MYMIATFKVERFSVNVNKSIFTYQIVCDDHDTTFTNNFC